jgi:hypothetical protein
VIDQIAGVVNRILLAAAFILGGLALWEKLANMAGRSLAFLAGYSPARLAELAAIVLLFVIALELRAIMNSVSIAKGPG